MYSNILVPIDADEPTGVAEALKAAQGLLSEGGTITVYSVIETPPVYVAEALPHGFEQSLEDSVIERMRGQVGEQEHVSLEVGHGRAAEQILHHAEVSKNDCIIVFARTLSFEKFVMGSVSQRVVRRANCPVLVLR